VRSYYDASERLRVSQRSYFFTDPGNNPRYRMALQEYFYDALGRRIAMRSRRDSTCTDTGDPTPGWDCAQTMERFIWDGDQLLTELRDYGWWGEDPYTLNGNGSSTGAFYGQAAYVYALGLFGPDTPLLVSGNIGTIVPQANWRGNYEDGTATDGSDVSGSTSYPWPGQRTGMYLAPDARIAPILARKWAGSIIEGKADPSGLIYDRNRYYDPTAGRFTQEDPAGLGGGVNLYGYAGADPANSRDPFGLRPDTVYADSNAQPQVDNCRAKSSTCDQEVKKLDESKDYWEIKKGALPARCTAKQLIVGCTDGTPVPGHGSGGTITFNPADFALGAVLIGVPVNSVVVLTHEASHALGCMTEPCAIQIENQARKEVGLPPRKP
jgi:RHS repeat-associated protein